MIIWINGAFGSGKTQTAYELHRRIPSSYIFDPENAGFYIRKNIPKELEKEDFQDYTMWREFNYSMLKYIHNEYRGIVIVPMTIVNPQFFKETIGRLRNEGTEVNHFVLGASKEVLLARLRSRGEGATSWAAQQIDRCIRGLSDEVFKYRLNTDNMSIESIVEQMAKLSNLNLLPDNRGRAKKIFDRIKIQIKHIRFFP